MRRLLPLAAILVVVPVAACSGDDDETKGDTRTPAAQAAPQQTVDDSAAAFAGAETFSGTFILEAESPGLPVNTTGEMAYRGPNTSYIKLDDANDTEALLIDNDFYVLQSGEWIESDAAAETGIDFAALYHFLNNRGPVSYEELTSYLTDLEALPAVTMDGQEYLHISGTVPAENIDSLIPDEVIDAETLAENAENIQDAHVDLFLVPETLLPREISAEVALDLRGQPSTFELTLDFAEFNGDVTIPEGPPDDIEPLPIPTEAP